jgi:hypothetical protein
MSKIYEALGGRKFVGFLIVLGALVANSLFKLDMGIYMIEAYAIYAGANVVGKFSKAEAEVEVK